MNAPEPGDSMAGTPSGAPWQRLLNRPSQFAMDGVVLALAFLISYMLRFEFTFPDLRRMDFLIQLPLVVLIQFGALQVFGVYSFVWR
ncbi:MAG: hypothetical protein ACC660_06120, partial [Acidimicrobiales bacterium]